MKSDEPVGKFKTEMIAADFDATADDEPIGISCPMCYSNPRMTRLLFIVAGNPICARCYEQLVAGAAKIAEYNAAVDMVAKARKRK